MAFPGDWNRKCKITISNTYVGATGEHLFLVTKNHIPTECIDAGSNTAQNGGGDLRFSSDSAGTTRLDCYVEAFVTNATAASRECSVFVKVPSVSSSVDTDIYIWYNTAGTESQPAVTASYGRDACFDGFDFFTNDFATDLTGNQTITVGNAPTVIDAGWDGGNAGSFDGTSDYVYFPIDGTPSISITGDLCVSMLIKGDNTAAGASYDRVYSVRDGSNNVVAAQDDDGGTLTEVTWAAGSESSTGTMTLFDRDGNGPNDTWETFDFRHTGIGTGEEMQINRSNYTTSYAGWGVGTDNADWFIGSRDASNDFGNFDGTMFRVRAGTAIADGALDTEDNNYLDDANFASAGTPESAGGATNLVISESLHSHVADNLALTQAHTLVISESNHALASENVVLVDDSATSDMKVQHVSNDIGNSGGTDTITAVSALTAAFEHPASNRRTHAGATTFTSNIEGDDVAGGTVLTATDTLTFYRESGSISNNMRFETDVIEYIGDASGDNEFIVRNRYAVALNGTTASTSVSLTGDGVVDPDKCIPIITGIMNNATTDDADSGTAVAWLTSTTNMEVEKGSNGNNVTVYITLVEFTGANWTVLHGEADAATGDTGSITLYDGSDFTGTATNVSAWAEAVIFGQFRADHGASGTNDAIADLYPIYDPGTGLQTVDWTFDANHDASDNRHVVHVLNNASMAVTRFQDTSSTQGESTVDITSAGLTDLEQSFIIGFSISSGTGTAYGRGWRNYYLNSLTQAAHWCHRSGNTMSHELQVVDLAGLTTDPGGATNLVISESLHSHGADNLDLTQAHTLVVAESAHGHSADNLDLTQAHTLVLSDGLHSHAADNLDLVENTPLIVADSTHSFTSDNLALTQAHILGSNDGLHGHVGDNLALTQAHVLAANDSTHSHSAENVVISTAVDLEIQAASHSHSADNLDLAQLHNLLLNDASHAHSAEGITLTVAPNISDATHVHGAENVTLEVWLNPSDSSHALVSDNLELTQYQILAAANATHGLTSDDVDIVFALGEWQLRGEDATSWNAQAADNSAWGDQAEDNTAWSDQSEDNTTWTDETPNGDTWTEQ